MSNRKQNGQFAQGNPGGPGRPPRATERVYLATLADNVTLEDWQAIVERAKADALAGDHHARQWFAKYLIGPEPPKLIDVAARELLGNSPDCEVPAYAKEIKDDIDLIRLF